MTRGLVQRVDYTWLPFFKHFYGSSSLKKQSSTFCAGNTPIHQMQLNHMAEFTERFAPSEGATK